MIGAIASLGAGLAYKYGSDYIKGLTSNHFAEKRARDQASLEYEYARRYSENSPSWNVSGLRAAGLNPILAASGGFSSPNWHPSSPSVPDTNGGGSVKDVNDLTRFDPLTRRQITLLDEQIRGQQIKNKNDLMNRGLTGQYGAYSRVLSEAQNAISSKPEDYEKVMESVKDAISTIGSFIKNGPSIDKSKSPASESYRIDGSSFDTPPEMTKWQKHVITDGFDSRLWSRSSRKHDGQYRYEKRQPWKSIFTR